MSSFSAEIEVGARGAAVLAERPAASTTVAAMAERITLRSDMIAPSSFGSRESAPMVRKPMIVAVG
jgi:hypothetical protein